MNIGRTKLTAQLQSLAFIALWLVPTNIWGQQNDLTPTSKALIEAIRTGGLPAAANLVEHYVTTDDGDVETIAGSLSDLAQVSEAVVCVSIVSQLPAQLTLDELGITTDYVVTVTERFQGSIEVGSQTTVRTVGGIVTFGNQTTAEVRSGRVPRISVGQEYVLFLRRPSASQPFTLTLGPQGVFTFGPDGRTQSRGRHTDPLFRLYQGTPREQFLPIVRSSVTP